MASWTQEARRQEYWCRLHAYRVASWMCSMSILATLCSDLWWVSLLNQVLYTCTIFFTSVLCQLLLSPGVRAVISAAHSLGNPGMPGLCFCFFPPREWNDSYLRFWYLNNHNRNGCSLSIHIRLSGWQYCDRVSQLCVCGGMLVPCLNNFFFERIEGSSISQAGLI